MFVDGLRLDQLEALGLVIDGSSASRDWSAMKRNRHLSLYPG